MLSASPIGGELVEMMGTNAAPAHGAASKM
jgi:hypothetical protein